MVFSGKHYLVTGGASGIGLEAARQLAAQGARLTLWDVNADALEPAARSLNARACTVDVTDGAAVDAAMAESARDGLDGVLHAAGVMYAGMFDGVALDKHRRQVDVNLTGTVNVAYSAYPHLRRTRGVLALMGSISAFYGGPEFAVYGATKAAVLNMAQALRSEWSDSGVQVSVVCPHFVNTPMIAGDNQKARFLNKKSVFLEVNTPQDTARAVLEGVAARRFMIYPSWRAALVFYLTRYADWIAGPLMHLSWKF